MVKRSGCMTFLVAAGALLFAANAEAQEWGWMVEPYVWATSIGSDVHANQPPIEGSTEMDFRDILDKLDGAVQLHAEGRGDGMGVFADFTYLGIADSHSGNFARTEADLDTRLFEAAWVWTPSGQRDRGLDLFGGVRYLEADFTLAIDPANPELAGRVLDVGDNYLDAMLGGRYTWVPGDRWRVTARADTSVGQTGGSWNASVMAQYRTAHGAVLFGYRHLEVELESAGVRTDLTMTGPIAGYAFIF